MDDQDSWIRKHINKKRLEFLDKLKTDLFAEGFPRIHESTRSKILCSLRQEGYFSANSILLDCIIRIDEFPRLFVDFCRSNDCNISLMKYIEKGLKTYEELHRHSLGYKGSHNSAGRHRNGHSQVSFPSAPPEELDQSSKKSGKYVERLLKQLECPPVCDNREIIGETEHREVSRTTESEMMVERFVENETIFAVLVDASVVTGAGLSDTAPGVMCPCLQHAGEGHNHPGETHESDNENEIEFSCSLSDTQHLQRNDASSHINQNSILLCENNASVCDPNNMNTNDPDKKTSCYSNKMEMKAKKTTKGVSKNVTKGKNKNKNVTQGKTNDKLINTRTNEHLDGSNEIQSNSEKASHQNVPSEKIGEHENESDHSESIGDRSESMGSYYLTSSDEEECLPPQNCYEIENLKISCTPAYLEEPMQKSNSEESTFGNQQITIPKEIEDSESSEASKTNFLMLSTSLSGTQCQEDIEKYKTVKHTTERIEHSAVNDVSKTQGLLDSLICKNLPENNSSYSELLNTSTNILSQISNHDNTLIKLGTEESINDNQEPVESDNRNAITNLNEAQSVISDTEFMQTEEIINKTVKQEIFDGNQIQWKSDASFSDAFNMTSTGNKGFEEKSIEVNKSSSVPLFLSNNPVLASAAASEGFEVHFGLSEFSELETEDFDSISAMESYSSHDLETCQLSSSSEINCSTVSSSEEVNTADILSTNELAGETGKSGLQECSDIKPQTNTADQIGEDDSHILTASYQYDSTEHHINLLEPNQETAANNYIEDNRNISSSIVLNDANLNTRPSVIYRFSVFMRDLISIYFPEFGVKL